MNPHLQHEDGEDARPAARSRRRLRLVTIERPRCPECGGIKLRKYRSLFDQGDGTALWWVRCADPECGQRFKVLLE